jgi:hypothetical protein
MRGTHGETASKHESGQTMTVIWIRGREACWSKTTGTQLGVGRLDASARTTISSSRTTVRDLMARIRPDLPVAMLNR